MRSSLRLFSGSSVLSVVSQRLSGLRSTAAGLAILLTLSLAAPARADRIDEAVMPVLVQNLLGKRHGTAFGLGDGSWAVTCYHVVAFPLGDGEAHVQRTVTVTSPWSGNAETARVVATDAEADLALLRLEAAGLPGLPLAPRAEIEALVHGSEGEDERLAIAGYPPPPRLLTADMPVGVRRNAGPLMAAGEMKGVPQFILQKLPDVGPGWSGGPLYLPESRRVVGVFHALIARKTEPDLFFPRAISALRIWRLLEAAGVKDFRPFLDPPAPPTPDASAEALFRHEVRASLAAQAGQWDLAVSEREAQLKLRPGSARARAGLAGALFARGKQEEAWAEFAESARLDPQRARTFYGWASALEQAGRLDEAAERYARAVELAPEDPEIRISQAILLRRQQKLEAALAVLEKAAAAAPNHPLLLGLRGEILVETGKVDESLPGLRRAVRLGAAVPLARSLRSTLVTALKKAGRVDEAEAELRAMAGDGTGDALDAYYLAAFLLERGKREEARSEAQRCLDLKPDARTEAAARALLDRLAP
jgi:tetratricopeptide (TPR) repeat protein